MASQVWFGSKRVITVHTLEKRLKVCVCVEYRPLEGGR